MGSTQIIPTIGFTQTNIATSSEMTAATTTASPTEIGDIQYVGVVVGAICIALFTLFSCLTIISARRSNRRDSRRREIQGTSCPEEDDRPDVVAENAPPSYDAVMACPDMYPPTPQGTPVGTPESTPYLSLHRHALINQHQSSLSISPQPQRSSMPPAASDERDEEQEPPPPYPGFSNDNAENATNDLAGREENRNSTGTGESTRGGNVPGNMDRGSDRDQSNSSLVNQDNNPWVLNSRVNNSREMSSRGNNPRKRTSVGHSTPCDNELTGSEDFALQVRIPERGFVDVSDDQDCHRNSVSSGEALVVQDLTEPVVNSDSQLGGLRNSTSSIAKSDINNGTSPISALGLV